MKGLDPELLKHALTPITNKNADAVYRNSERVRVSVDDLWCLTTNARSPERFCT